MSDRTSKRSHVGIPNSKSSRGSISSKVALQNQYRSRGLAELPSLNPMSPTMRPPGHPPTPPKGKMLLPPLARAASQAGSSKPIEKNRTAHACDKCRKSKAKCSGGQPCEKCLNEGKECVYGDGKRDSEKKALELLGKEKERLIKYNSKLKERLMFICQMKTDNQLSSQDIADAKALVHHYKASDCSSEESNDEESPPKAESECLHGEDFADAEVGSTGSIDNLHEDTNRDERSRATGYMGKSSAVTWVQRAKKQSEAGQEGSAQIPNNYTDSSYLAQDSDFPSINEDGVNPFELPVPFLARALIDCYFDYVHICFPVLCKMDFMREFNEWTKCSALDEVTEKQQKWLCLLNVIFAIGSRYAHVMGLEWRGDELDHLIYIARSKKLGMDARTLYQNPELSHTTNLCLMGLYFISTDQINKAWIVTGIAIRNGLALGLHVRSLTDELTSGQKQIRIRHWWALYSLERVLDEILGRPSAISDRDICTPLPSNLNDEELSESAVWLEDKQTELSTSTRSSLSKRKSKATIVQSAESSSLSPAESQSSSADLPLPSAFTFPLLRLPITSSTLFIYRVQLSIITHEILSQLYCTTMIKAKWGKIQDTMRRIDSRLKEWKAHLPREFDFTAQDPDDEDGYENHRIGLGIFYNSARMILFRPCLCKFDGAIKGESQRSKSFNGKAAGSCIRAAHAVISAIPSDDPKRIHALVPWWSTVHYIIQAASILMLELAHRAEHVPSQAAKLVSDSKKAVHYLSMISDQSVSARKGWEVLNGLLRIVAPKVRINVSDTPTTAPLPPSWRHTRYGTGSYHGQSGNPLQNDSAHHPISTSDWVDQTSYGGMLQYSSATAMAPVYAAGPGTHIQQYYAGSLQPFGLAGPYMGLHDEFDPWQSMFYDGGTAYGTTPSMGDTIPTSTSTAMEGLEITQPRAGASNFGLETQDSSAAPLHPSVISAWIQ